jgi:hypothetical protein
MEINRRAETLMIIGAVYLLVDVLLLAPVLVIAIRWPQLVWFALGPYLFFTFGMIGLLLYLDRRWGLMEFTGTHMRGLRVAAIALILPTAGYFGIVITWPRTVAAATVIYFVILGYVIYRLVKWQQAHFAFECQESGQRFKAGLKVWLLSPNMGTKKWVTCIACGKHTLAKIIDADGLAGHQT